MSDTTYSSGLQNDLLLRAAKGLPVERPPVWVMRQAGRYLPEFRKLKEDNDSDFFRMCQTPSIAAEITLQPLRRYPELDAAIIFSDILVIPQVFGMAIDMVPAVGPVFQKPLQEPSDLDSLAIQDDDEKTRSLVHEQLAYVYDAIRLTKEKMAGRCPLIGFAGAPWTLMAYMIEGKGAKTFSRSKRWIYEYPDAAKKLLRRLAVAIGEFLVGQARAGAHALQVFDSWAGDLSVETYREFCAPCLEIITRRVRDEFGNDIPLILFAKGAPHAIDMAASWGFDVAGVDWIVAAAEARDRGNLDPSALFGNEEAVRARVRRMLDDFGPQRHIVNLGHGMTPQHTPEQLAVFLDEVHTYGKELYEKQSQRNTE